eukprot:2721907-Ditylum_brightwellii.AAC.1
MLVEFDHEPKNFLGMRLEQLKQDNNISIFLSQEATIDALIHDLGLESANIIHTLYRSGCPVDKIPDNPNLPPLKLAEAQDKLCSI